MHFAFAPSGGGRRVATLNDDSDDDGDEARNYFAGGERRHVSSEPRTLSLSPRCFHLSGINVQNLDRGPDSSGRNLIRDLLACALGDGRAGVRRSAEV
jgi:hypothetical protein